MTISACRLSIHGPSITRILSQPTSPSISGDKRVFLKNSTAISPVTTPILSVSAAAKSCPKRRRSSALKSRLLGSFGESRISKPSVSIAVITASQYRCGSLRCLSAMSSVFVAAIHRSQCREPPASAEACCLEARAEESCRGRAEATSNDMGIPSDVLGCKAA